MKEENTGEYKIKGMEKFMCEDDNVPMAMEKVEMKTMKIAMNEGQTMLDKKFMGTGKKFKPKGRK